MPCTVVNGDFEDETNGWDIYATVEYSYEVLGDPGDKYLRVTT